MAAYDIMPFRSSHGGHIGVETYQLAPSQTFNQGEPVLVDANGQLAIAADMPDPDLPTSVVGIAAEPAQGMATSATGVTNATDSPRSVFQLHRDNEFITKNFGTTANSFTGTMDQTNIGDIVNIEVNASVWGINSAGGGTNRDFVVTQVLDANKNPVTGSATGTYVVFRKLV